MTEHLASENLTETVNDPSKFMSNVQSAWLSSRLNAAAVQSKFMDSIDAFQDKYLKGSFSLRLIKMIMRFF